MSSSLSPAVLNDVCPDCGAEHPEATPCLELVARTPDLNLAPEECAICEEKINPGPAPIVEVTGVQFCKSADPAYEFYQAKSARGGEAFLVQLIDPGCSRVLKGCSHCTELCVDADEVDRFRERIAGDNTYSWSATGAVMPLIFYVDPIYASRVNHEYGYVVVGNHNGANEWYPKSQIQSHYYPSFDKPYSFSGGDLNNFGALLGAGIGNIPYIQTEVEVAPKAIDDESTGAVDTNQVLDVTTNDFDLNGDIDVATVVLLDPADDTYKASVTIAGEGVYTSNGDGTVTFAPEAGVTGDFDITYKVSDAEGNQSQPATATYTVV